MTDKVPPSETKRLSLDLPIDHHEMLDEIAKVTGHASKSETVRAAIEMYYEFAHMAKGGLDIATRNEKTAEVKVLHIVPLSGVARRARQSQGMAA